jgi:hypothetical protein
VNPTALGKCLETFTLKVGKQGMNPYKVGKQGMNPYKVGKQGMNPYKVDNKA